MSRTTTQALKEHQAHEHKGAHPYRVVLGEVRAFWGGCEGGQETGREGEAGAQPQGWRQGRVPRLEVPPPTPPHRSRPHPPPPPPRCAAA
jgi:hypothetical protein